MKNPASDRAPVVRIVGPIGVTVAGQGEVVFSMVGDAMVRGAVHVAENSLDSGVVRGRVAGHMASAGRHGVSKVGSRAN